MEKDGYRFDVKEEKQFDRLKINCLDTENNVMGFLVFKPAMPNGLVIDNIEVQPGFRRQGIGSRLLDFLKELASREYGRASINTHINPVNPRNSNLGMDELLLFYRNNGFQINAKSSYEAEGFYKFK